MATRRIGNLNITFTPTQDQTQLHNALGRTAGQTYADNAQNQSGNIFENAINGFGNSIKRKASAAENSIGTTLSVIPSLVNNRIENRNIENRQQNWSQSLKDIANKYGFEDVNAAWDYEDDARERGDTAAVENFERTIGEELRRQANANANEANKASQDWNDYRTNSYIGQKMEQDNGKFGGDALSTLSTAADVAAMTTGLPMGIAANAVQGGVEGFANELSQNGGTFDLYVDDPLRFFREGAKVKGWDDFDWIRAGQDAAIGAASGAATAGLNKALGARAAAKAVPSATTKAPGLIKSVASGAGRGALSGAVGGAVGAGTSSVLNRQDIQTGLQNVLSGATQGAAGGAVSGGIMGGVNNLGGRAINAIDRKFDTNLGEISKTGQKWQQSGKDFNERLTNTLNSGDSAVGNWINGKQSNILGAAGNLGNRVQDVGDTLENVNNLVDNTGQKIPPEIAQRLADIDPRLLDENGNIKVMYHGTPNGGFERFDDGTYFTADKEYADVYQNPSASSLMPKKGTKNPMTYDTYIDAKRLFDINDSDARKIYVDDYIKGGNANGIDPYRTSYDDVNNIDWTEAENLREFLNNNPQYGYDGIIVDEGGVPNDNGGVTYRGKSVIPMSGDQVIMRKSINQAQTPTTANTVRLYRGLEQEYEPNYPASRLDTNGYESWTDNPELAKQYGKNVYYIDVPESDIQGSYLDENPNSPTYGDRYPLYKTAKAAGLNGISGNEYQLEVGSDYQKGLTYTPLEGTDAPTTTKGWAKKAGQRIVEDLNNSNLGNRVKDVSSDMPEDIRNMQIRDYNANADGQNSSRPYEYIGANGKKALKIEMPILNDVPAEESSAFIKQAVMDLAQEGRLLNVGDIPELANISRTTSKKIGGPSGWTDSQLRQRNEIIADIEEVGDYLHNVRFETPKEGANSNVAGVIKGDVEVDINGEKIYPEVVYRVYDNGDLVLHDVTKINRLPSGNSSDHNLGRYVKPSEATKQPRDTSILPQNSQNVNTIDPWDRVAQEAGYSNYDEVLQRYAEANPNAKINPRGMAGQVLSWMDKNPNTPTTASGWAKKAGQRAVEDINNSNLGLRVKDVNSDDQSRQLYNLLAGNQEIVEEPQLQTSKVLSGDDAMATTTAKTMDKTSFENAADREAGFKLAQQYGTIDKKTANATNASETFAKISKQGFTKPAEVERIANAVTGADGEVSKLVQNLVQNAQPVNTFDGETAGQTLDDFIDKSIHAHGISAQREGQSVRDQLESRLSSLPSRTEGSLTSTDDGVSVFKLIQGLEADAAEWRGKSGNNYATTTQDKTRAAKVVDDVVGLLKDRLFDSVDVKDVLTPEVAANLKAYAPNNQKWADTVDNELMTATNIKDLRKFQAPYVRAKKIIDNGSMNVLTYGGKMTNGFGLSKKGLVATAARATLNSNPGLRAQAKVLQTASKAAGKIKGENVVPTTTTATATANPQTEIYDLLNKNNTLNIIGRNTGEEMGEKARPIESYIEAASAESGYAQPLGVSTTTPTSGSGTLESLASNGTTATTPTTMATTLGNTGSGYTGQFSNTGDEQIDLIGRAMELAMAANDADAFGALYSMYNEALSSEQKSSSDLSAAQQTQLAKFDSAKDAINELETLFNEASGAKGLVAGWLQSRAGDIGLDSGASTYNQMAEGLVNQIAQAIGKTDSLNTEGEVKRALRLVPQLTDDAQTAQNKLRTLRKMLAQTKSNYYNAYGA